MGKRCALWVLVGSLLGFSFAQGTGREGVPPATGGKEPAPLVVRLDAGTTPLPLASVFRSLAASVGYSALVADIPEEKKVVVRRLELPLEEAVRFLVGTFLGEEYGYGILPDRKLLVVGKRRNLEALVANAVKVDLAPSGKGADGEAGGEKGKGDGKAQGEGGKAPSPPAAYRVFTLPPQVDPDSVGGLGSLFPSLRLVFVRSVSGPLLVVSGPGEDLEAFAHLWKQLEEGWHPQAPQAPQEAEEDRFFPLPQGVQREEVEALLSAANLSAKVQVFPRQVYCRGVEAECARLGRLLQAAFPAEAPAAEKPAPEPLFLHAYPVYGNPEEVAEAVRQALGKRLEEEGGSLYLAKEARQLVLRASRALHQEVYALLEKIDLPPARRTQASPVAQASYRPLYVEAASLAGELRARFPELKVEVKEGRVVFEGAPGAVRQAADFVQAQDRPKPQVVYRVIVFATNDRHAQDLNASLTSALRAGINLSIDGLLRAGGILPPSPNAASSLAAALEMAEQKGWGKSILNTTLVGVDGEEAFLQSGGKVAVLSASGSNSSSDGGSGSGQTSQSSPGTPLEYDYGLILKVKPKVLSTDLVQTTVSLEISDEPTLGGNVLRYTRKRTEGQYLIPPGGILAIGGVLSTRESRSREGIPLLMDLPLLGALFSKESRTVSSEYLLIYLIPETVSYPPSQAEPPAFREPPAEEAPDFVPRRPLPEEQGTPRQAVERSAKAEAPSPKTAPPASPSLAEPLPSKGVGSASDPGPSAEAATPPVEAASPKGVAPAPSSSPSTGTATLSVEPDPSKEAVPALNPAPPSKEDQGAPRSIRVEVRRASTGTLLRFLDEGARPLEIRVNGVWYRLLPASKDFWALLAPLEQGLAYEVRMPGGEVVRAVFVP